MMSEMFCYLGFSFEAMCTNSVTCLSLLIKTVMCIILGRGSLKKSSPFLLSVYLSIFNLYDKLSGGKRLILSRLVLLPTWGYDKMCASKIHKPISLWQCLCSSVQGRWRLTSERTASWASGRLFYVLVPGWLPGALAFLRVCKYGELFCTRQMFITFFLLDMIRKLIILSFQDSFTKVSCFWVLTSQGKNSQWVLFMNVKKKKNPYFVQTAFLFVTNPFYW